jgi:phage terminase large subunit
MLTDLEILELEKLLEQQEIDERRERLKDPNHESHTKNYKFLQAQRIKRKYDSEGNLIEGTNIEVLEGSARSGKTISVVDETIRIGLFEPPRTIFIIRGTFAEIKTSLYTDYKERLDYFDLPNPFHDKVEIKTFKIGNATITFLGADKIGKKLGAGSDYLYFNEVLHGISEHVFKQLVTRCNIATFCDYNPAFTQHWFYEKVLKRRMAGYLRTTYRDNQYCPPNQRAEIESAEPWEPGSYEVIDDAIFYEYEEISDSNRPPAHSTNVPQQTADEEFWRVYGLGLRGAMKGRIFKKYTILDSWPKGLGHIFGNDFGFSNDPNAIVKYSETKDDIFIQPMFYAPVDNSDTLEKVFEKIGIQKTDLIIADSSDRFVSGKHGVVKMVQELFYKGWNIRKVSKTKSTVYWLGSMKKKRINLVKSGNDLLDKALQDEFDNYIWKEIQGIQINQPDDKCKDHKIDASKYCHMSWQQSTMKFKSR